MNVQIQRCRRTAGAWECRTFCFGPGWLSLLLFAGVGPELQGRCGGELCGTTTIQGIIAVKAVVLHLGLSSPEHTAGDESSGPRARILNPPKTSNT